MSRGGRHSSIFLCAAFAFCCGTLLASPPTEAKTTSEGLFEGLENLEIRTQDQKESQQGIQVAASTPRFFGEVEADHDFHFMVLPMQNRRIQQFEQPTVVRELRSALHDSTLVAKSVGQRTVSKSEKKEGKGQGEEGREARAGRQGQDGRDFGTLWEAKREHRDGGGRGGEHSVGDEYTNADSSSKAASSGRVNPNQCRRKGEREERGGWRVDEQSQSDEEAACRERHHRRGSLAEPQQPRASGTRSNAGATLDSQGADAAAEIRKSSRYVAHADWRTRPKVEGLARVHDQEACRATLPFPDQTADIDGKVCRNEGKGQGAAERDQGSRRFHEAARGRRVPGDWRRKSIRRKNRSDCDVSLYDEEEVDRDVCFVVSYEQLENWDSKPWSYRPGQFTEHAWKDLYQQGAGLQQLVNGRDNRVLCQGRFAEEINELYGIKRLCGERALRDLAGRDLLHGWKGRTDIRGIATYGLCNVAVGDRSVEIDLEGATSAQDVIDDIEGKIQELWNDRWQQYSTRIYVVDPQPQDGQLHLIVEFEGANTAMHNVPVLFEECCYDGTTTWTMRQAAYLGHLVRWQEAAEQLGISPDGLSRRGNILCIWVGPRMITDDEQYMVRPGCKYTMSYRTHGDGEYNDDGSRQSKRPRTTEEGERGRRDEHQEEGHLEGEDGDVEGGESEDPQTSEEEEAFTKAYMFHWVGDYALERLDRIGPVNRHAQVAEAWGIDPQDVIGLHPLRARPSDLRPDREALITRWRSDNEHRQWMTDVQVLLDIRLEGRDQGVKRRSVRWIRHQMTQQGILRWVRIDDYCRRTLADRCQIWFNNILWQDEDQAVQNIKMGDYLRVSLPPETTRSVLDQERRLARIERIQREERFFDDDETTSEEEAEQEEVPASESTHGRHTEEEPELHTEMKIPIALEGLVETAMYQPSLKRSGASEDEALDFSEVWDLLGWMDSAITIPSWIPPEGLDWHPATKSWIDDIAWWNLETPDEIWFYTDGSKMKEGSGAATIMYIKSQGVWYYGGFLSQPCPVRCAHFAELVALAMSMHWLNNVLMYCALTQDFMPTVFFAFDATSAGYKIFGRWGGDKYPMETNNLRSIWTMITMRYRFAWHTLHEKAHEGNPGNEGANTLAQGAAQGKFRTRSGSTWATFLTTTNEMAVHWLWALWKREWQPFWNGRVLNLPDRPTTSPDRAALQHLLHQGFGYGVQISGVTDEGPFWTCLKNS